MSRLGRAVAGPRQESLTVGMQSWCIAYVDAILGLDYELNVKIENSSQDRFACVYFYRDQDGDPVIDTRDNPCVKYRVVEHTRKAKEVQS